MPPPPGSRIEEVEATDLLLILIVSLLAVRVMAVVLVGFFEPSLPDGEPSPEDELAFTVSLLVINSLVILGAIRALALQKYGLSWRDLGLDRYKQGYFRAGLTAGLLSLPVVLIINALVQGLTGAPIENPQIEALAPLGFSWVAMLMILAVGGILVPFAEEMAFRGLLYRWLRPRLGTGGAIFVSGVLFAFLHGIPQLIPAIAALGMVLAVLTERTGSTWPAFIAHSVFNVAMTISLYATLEAGNGAV